MGWHFLPIPQYLIIEFKSSAPHRSHYTVWICLKSPQHDIARDKTQYIHMYILHNAHAHSCGIFVFITHVCETHDFHHRWRQTDWSLLGNTLLIYEFTNCLLSIPQECLMRSSCMSGRPRLCFHYSLKTIRRRIMRFFIYIFQVKSNIEFENGSRTWPLTRSNWRFS